MAMLYLIIALTTICSARPITDFGAVANDTSYEAAIRNGKALFDAFQAANSANATDRTVSVPDGLTFTMLPHAPLVGLRSVSMFLLGNINAFPGPMDLWPNASSSMWGEDILAGEDVGNRHRSALHLIHIDQSSDVVLSGSGRIIGNGYRWWWEVILTGHDNRPCLLVLSSVINVVIDGWYLENSPRYHIFCGPSLNVLIQHVVIHVAIDDQKQVMAAFGYLHDGLPTFPLNTDGIDVAGKNITVRNCHVENFDDSVCIKPVHGGSNLTSCTEDVHVHDITITNGVGASVGSVPPNTQVNCIRNVTFERISFDHPIKAIYVKPNPCDHPESDGTGVIDLITYKDIVADTPLWWAIWVSTQQQHQPGSGAGTGCSFFYPLPGTKCPTQPCVPVTRLTIKNFTATNALLSPGVLRCNAGGPCRDWLFEDVKVYTDSGFNFGDNFLCQAIENFTILGGSPQKCVFNVTDQM